SATYRVRRWTGRSGCVSSGSPGTRACRRSPAGSRSTSTSSSAIRSGWRARWWRLTIGSRSKSGYARSWRGNEEAVMGDADVVRSFYGRVGSGDLPGGLALVADDCTWTEMESFGHAGVYIGPESVRDNIFVRIGAEWAPFGLEVDEVLDAGSAVLGVGTYSGTSTDTGKSFTARVVHVFRV